MLALMQMCTSSMSALMKMTKHGAINTHTHTPCLVIANMAATEDVRVCISAEVLIKVFPIFVKSLDMAKHSVYELVCLCDQAFPIELLYLICHLEVLFQSSLHPSLYSHWKNRMNF